MSAGIRTHPAWLPDAALAPVGARRVRVVGEGLLADTVRGEVARAVAHHSGTVVTGLGDPAELVLGDVATLAGGSPLPEAVADAVAAARAEPARLGTDGFVLARRAGVTAVVGGPGPGPLYGLFHVLRLAEAAFGPDRAPEWHVPAHDLRMLDHWDNIDVHPRMGQVERGYSGGSIFYADGRVRDDLTRVAEYGRLLAAIGVNRVAINNVNVHAREARLLTDDLAEVARIASVLRPWGVRVHLSVGFSSPMVLGGLATADPLDPAVRDWWVRTTERVYAAVPDFGGYVVKADSEGQPGPFAYGRDHADGANTLARALAPFGGTVHWRAFVYDHRQDWRDRSTDRARAAYDHFAPLDGRFDDNVVLQVKHGPMDFQAREPVSPVIAAMPATRLAVELQVTQEYTGQQRHVCYLGPAWSEILAFRFWGPGSPTVSDVAAGNGPDATGGAGGIVAVSNVGDDRFWTGHPLAQANLYAFGRLAWQPELPPGELLDEWISLTFPGAAPEVRSGLHGIMDGSWRTYESYTAPLGVGFMVRPHYHYGPDVDGYEYTPWGTYHFADRDGIGVDRSAGSGTGYAAQYPKPWAEVYESSATCPDDLLLFFHHVPYGHVLQSGSTVIQHIYDTHFRGVEDVERMVQDWDGLAGAVPEDVFVRVGERLAEQLRSAREWRDQLCTYFLRKSGVPDAHGRTIHR
jgi:alpha-glucuronidase